MTTVESTSGGVVPEWTVADRLRKARTWAGISVEEMADDIGRSARTIRNYEHGATFPPLLVQRQYAFRCGVALSWIRGDGDGSLGVISPDTDHYAMVPAA